MRVNIDYNEKNYSSDSISGGRIIKKFYKQLCSNVFRNAYKYSKYHFDIIKVGDCPLWYSERNMYSLFSSSINQITPIHLTEWGFNKNNSNTNNTRRVDFWAMYKESENARATNFYIELKNGWYCLNKRAEQNMDNRVANSIKSLIQQLRSLKKIKPRWNDVDDVYLGLVVIYGYYREGQEKYTSDDLYNAIDSVIDKRTIQQFIVSTWIPPEEISIQWDKDRCKFISIIGLPIVP